MLDASRVHPETYEWARKMAIDALEYDENIEDANPAAALEVRKPILILFSSIIYSRLTQFQSTLFEPF